MSTAQLADLNLLLHVAATFYMMGLIWFVQRVHYPLFASVGAPGFSAYADQHVSRTTSVVGPPMLLEGGTMVGLILLPPAGIPPEAIFAGAALLAVIWLSTAWLQVPRHRDLAGGFAPRPHRRLVASNWIRTAAWSARSALVLWMLFLVLHRSA